MLPCGLGARDTLRTEMGYPLHGQDITIDVTPVQAGLGWAVGWKKDVFWGRDALVAERATGPKRKLRGLVALERGIPRPGMLVSLTPDVPVCEITSGTYSPTLKKGIGMALVPTFVDPEAELGVQIRTRREIFASHPLPFVDTSVRSCIFPSSPRPSGRRPRRSGRGGGSSTTPGAPTPACRRSTPTSASRPRPTPSRGSARCGPSSRPPGSPR
jgi:hypothetical protein